MGRIRTIKPEFFTHEGLYEMEVESGLPIRLCFAGLWTVCDREGRFKWRPRALKNEILPYDETDFTAILSAMESGGFVVRYEALGETFGYVPSFLAHQVINQREAKSRIPSPDGTDVHVHAHAMQVKILRETEKRRVPPDVRDTVLARDGHRCLRCPATDKLSIDHIFPWSMGGTNAVTNLRTLCKSCNSARPVAGQALIDDLAKDGLTLNDMTRMCLHVQSMDAHVGKGKEGKGKEGNVCNQASCETNAELHTQAPISQSSFVASVEREREDILNNSLTRAFNAPESELEALPGDHPQVLDFVAEARRVKAQQQARALQFEPTPEIPPEVFEYADAVQAFADGMSGADPNLIDESAATSLDSATSHVDKSQLRTEAGLDAQNRDEKIAQNCPESASLGVDEATPYLEAQTSQDATKAREDEARKLPVETYQEQKGEVLPPGGDCLPGEMPDWVELILSLYGKGRHAYRAKTAVIDAITREVAGGRQANESAAASWLFERTQCFMDIYTTWPAHENKFLWDAVQFFNDGHYADEESTWRRDAKPTAQQQRDLDTEAAVQRTLQRLGSSGSNHPRLPVPGSPEQPDAKRSATSVIRAGLGGFASLSVGHGLRAR